ncbi:hypothetical protein [Shewanella sp.]|uniref:hypothetical protein n=1 Tax=Shewanella sp. TaxID=50422 RepID=UPI003A97F674
MNSYDDIAALTSKISQEELNFQTFNEKAVTTTSSWALLNELLHGAEQPKASQPVAWAAAPTAAVKAQPAVTTSVAAASVAPETTPSTTSPAGGLSSILKKATR